MLTATEGFNHGRSRTSAEAAEVNEAAQIMVAGARALDSVRRNLSMLREEDERMSAGDMVMVQGNLGASFSRKTSTKELRQGRMEVLEEEVERHLPWDDEPQEE